MKMDYIIVDDANGLYADCAENALALDGDPWHARNVSCFVDGLRQPHEVPEAIEDTPEVRAAIISAGYTIN
jgi:hypothetical protein